MENRKKKTIIIASIMVVILIIAIILVIKLISINKSKVNEEVVAVNNIEIENNIIEENVIENTIEEDNIENQIEESQNQTLQNEVVIQNTPVADPEQEVDKETIQKQESDQEKAMNIAKKDWGEDDSVYFSYEYSENGKHIVFVRDSNTREICRYIIDVSTGTFEKNM